MVENDLAYQQLLDEAFPWLSGLDVESQKMILNSVITIVKDVTSDNDLKEFPVRYDNEEFVNIVTLLEEIDHPEEYLELIKILLRHVRPIIGDLFRINTQIEKIMSTFPPDLELRQILVETLLSFIPYAHLEDKNLLLRLMNLEENYFNSSEGIVAEAINDNGLWMNAAGLTTESYENQEVQESYLEAITLLLTGVSDEKIIELFAKKTERGVIFEKLSLKNERRRVDHPDTFYFAHISVLKIIKPSVVSKILEDSTFSSKYYAGESDPKIVFNGTWIPLSSYEAKRAEMQNEQPYETNSSVW